MLSPQGERDRERRRYNRTNSLLEEWGRQKVKKQKYEKRETVKRAKERDK